MIDRLIEDDRGLEWFAFPGAETHFELTRSGLVRSKHRMVESPICGGQRRIGGRLLKTKRGNSYAAVEARINGKRRVFVVHRALAALFVPNHDGKPFINHIDGDKTNNAIENLEWCTHLENMRHAYRTGLAKAVKNGPGEECRASKLTDEDVREIKRRLAAGWTHQQIAECFGVVKGTVGFIARGETWGHIK